MMLRRAPIYCEAVLQPQDIYYEGSEDEDYDNAEARRQRYEAAGQRFLDGNVPLLLSATLKGPFEEESGWVNPWRSKNRTANSQNPRVSDDLNMHSTPKRLAPSASIEQHAIEALKDAECALPSPESLKQAPFTSSYSRPQETGGTTHGRRDNSVPLSRSSDEFWTTNSPSKSPKRKSMSSQTLDGVANKRQRTRSTEIETPTPKKNLIAKRDASQRGARTTRATSDSSSIYSHIRELTSQLPPAGSQDLSSEDADTDTDDDHHHETISTCSSVDFLLANARRTPKKDLTSKILRPNENSSLSLLSPFSQRSSRGASSPLSVSPAQTPTKRKVASSIFSSRRRSSGDLSTLSETPTNLSSLADLEMLGVDDDNSEDLDDATLIERQLREEQVQSPEISTANNRDHISTTPDTIPPNLPTSRPSYEEHPSREESIIETPKAKRRDHPDSSISKYDTPRGRLKPFRGTQSSRMADPLIYDDTEGSDQPTSGSGNKASSDSQQPVPSENPSISSPKQNKSQALAGRSATKSNSPHKSSPLRSLSPRNGRINSRPALKKMVQPYMSSLRKSRAASADESYSQEKATQQSNENEQEKEVKETSPPSSNTCPPASHPSPNEIATDKDREPDHSTFDDAQEELMDRDTSVSSTTPHSDKPPAKVTAPVEVVNSTQGDVPPGILEQDEPGLTTPELSTDLQRSIPIELANSDIIEPLMNGDAPKNPNEPSSIAPMADGDSCEGQQEHQDETQASTEAVAETQVLPAESDDMSQPPSNILTEPSEETPKRPSTPEPQFAVASFSTFMSPSPNPRRQRLYFSGPNLSGTASKTQGSLLSCMKRSWGSTIPKKRVSWAPLPHEGSDISGEDAPSGTDTSSSMIRGRDRAVSPPPPPSMGSSSDSLMEGDLKFGLHFAAVADRTKSINPQSTPAVPEYRSPSPDRQRPAESVDASLAEKNSFSTKTWGYDDQDPTDIVQDIFNDMDDFLQVWDVDAELNEARKADKTRASGAKGTERASEDDVDMFASFL
ncbi:uncharacterized protein TrAFT101_004789 [Trichoderma asperellum]|uniref:uncharacterized protein n=1 Tax=Trichoderma asperellum TaxID=101201 RepID=UPI00332B4BAD|nr:hypothetical protein TrAFT101_004789 [Trichoderma asperellum]